MTPQPRKMSMSRKTKKHKMATSHITTRTATVLKDKRTAMAKSKIMRMASTTMEKGTKRSLVMRENSRRERNKSTVRKKERARTVMAKKKVVNTARKRVKTVIEPHTL